MIGLNLSGSIGARRLELLCGRFGGPKEILRASFHQLCSVTGIGPAIAASIAAVKEEEIAREIELSAKLGLSLISRLDAGYPAGLARIPDAPLVLYVKGTLLPEDALAIAVVGSRRASLYGVTCARRFSQELGLRGVTVVSGLARGIDTAAHCGALQAPAARTIAVMGSGFEHMYPKENKELAEKIAQRGAVISEFPLHTLPHKQNFPRRNRLISGLSLGVLVVEAARNSGALITADYALEQGKEVFAVPGEVSFANSFGTHELIKQGAKLVSSVEDILEEIGVFPEGPPREAAGEKTGQEPALTESEKQLYGLIPESGIALEELIARVPMGMGAIYGTLTSLEIKKLIRQLPGKQIIRSVI